MDRASVMLVALAALWAAPAAANLQDLLLPLQELKYSLQPHSPQPQPQPQPHHQYQYRSAPSQGYAHGYAHGYADPSSGQPIVYQWMPQWMPQGMPSRPMSYEAGTPYSRNSLGTWLQQQTSWLPWNGNRPPLQGAQQPLQGAQQQLQAFWSILPWNSNGQPNPQATVGTSGSSNPVLSFFQNPIAMLPWSQQSQHANRPVYTTPLAPVYTTPLATVPSTQSLQVLSEQSPSGAVVTAAGPNPGVIVDDTVSVQQLPDPLPNDNGIRRIAIHQFQQDGQPCA